MNGRITYRILLNQEIKRSYYDSLLSIKERAENKDDLEIKSSLIWMMGRESFDIELGQYTQIRDSGIDLASGRHIVTRLITLKEKGTYNNPITDISISFKASGEFIQYTTELCESGQKGLNLGKFLDHAGIISSDIFVNYIETYKLKLDLYQVNTLGYSLISEIPETLIKL